jgi:hypothetical protein
VEHAHHDFAVNEVFGAAEGDETDFGAGWFEGGYGGIRPSFGEALHPSILLCEGAAFRRIAAISGAKAPSIIEGAYCEG